MYVSTTKKGAGPPRAIRTVSVHHDIDSSSPWNSKGAMYNVLPKETPSAGGLIIVLGPNHADKLALDFQVFL